MNNRGKSVSDTYKEYSDDILNYSFSLLKDRDAAEDAVQEVFVRYINSQDSFRGECSEKTWLLTITRNYCFKQLSKKTAAGLRLVDNDYPLQYEPKLDTLITLKDALNDLPAEEYELIYLREYAGYSYQEIANILTMSIENVKVRLFRTRQKLKQYLTR